ncbi:MAG: efflux transporter outer membrane subunit [Methylococcus sp.]|nr:efflux transporter outer membrane subunit [Methylococcus sp.]
MRFVPLGLIVTLLAGCAGLFPEVGPDYQKPALTPPSHWSDDTAASPNALVAGARISHWWRQLGDSQLDKLIDAALVGNLDLHLAEARLRQARFSREQAEANLYPTLKATGDITQREIGGWGTGNQSSRTDIGAGIGSGGIGSSVQGTEYNTGFDASWEVDIFGGIRRGIEAATADQDATEARLNNTRVSLAAEVARNYVEVRSYQRRLTIARDNLATQSDTLQITEWRYQAGLTTEIDVEQARTNREQTRAGIPDLEVGQRKAENRLAVLLGRNPGDLHHQLAEPRDLPPLPATLATGIPSDVLRQRPDVIAAERTLAAETARVGQKLAKRFPSLNLSASLNWYTFASSGITAAIQTVGASLATTIFDAGRLRTAVDIQSAVQEQALISYRNSMLTALEEVENALKSYAAGHERVDARRIAAGAAQNAAQLSRQRYEAGVADFEDVLITERTRLTAEDNLALAEAELRTSLISLYKALGGGWEETAGTSVSSNIAHTTHRTPS